MNKYLLTIAVFAFMVFSITVVKGAEVPLSINFQGKLTDSNQAPINVPADITFSIYDADIAGTLLWSEDYTGITVTNGIFNVLLGSGTPDPANTGDISTVLTGEDRWLEVQVGSDPAMTPRQQITSVAYSLHSSTAANADDVLDKDINPNSVTIPAFGPVIDSNGQWVGDPTGLIGPEGPQGDKGDPGPSGCNWVTLALAYHHTNDGRWSEAYWVPLSWIGNSGGGWGPFHDTGNRMTVCTR